MTIRDEAEQTTAEPTSVSAPTPEHDVRAFMPPPAARIEESEMGAVFPPAVVNELRPMWTAIQADFIDEPRQSVQAADGLVAATIQRLVDSLASERAKLESQWANGDDVSTEDLRLALRRYRSFFDRLLSA